MSFRQADGEALEVVDIHGIKWTVRREKAGYALAEGERGWHGDNSTLEEVIAYFRERPDPMPGWSTATRDNLDRDGFVFALVTS